MATVFIAFILLSLVIAGMAIGVLCGRKPISGSCGGLGAVGVGGPCEICGGDPNKCDAEEGGDVKKTDLAIDATQTKSQ